MKRRYSAPTSLNLEITDRCTARCRHCYNFWRETGAKTTSMTKEKFDLLLREVIESGVFHVVLTGGEPFLNFDFLEHACQQLVQNNISISVNSNLMLTSDDNIKRLHAAGVDHVLTSLNSHDEEVNDYLVQRKGAFKKIIKGIECALENDIRVSVNMIISQNNKEHVYKTAKFAHELGCQKIFGTRTVPPVSYDGAIDQSEFIVSKKDVLYVVDQLVQAKEDMNIMIGSLVSYPLCLLGDLEKYMDFVGRGCPAQSGHRMSINADGESHCCVHEEKGYGNVFKIGIKKAYQNMHSWHDGSFINEKCDGCRYIGVCESGCRMSALGYFGAMDAQDPLMVTESNFSRHYKFKDSQNISKKIGPKTTFTVPSRLRFREERGFYLLNIQWANTIEVENKMAQFLMQYQKNGRAFTLAEFNENKKEVLFQLLLKNAIESKDISLSEEEKLIGLSLDPSKLEGA